jgi:hypothetical protein
MRTLRLVDSITQLDGRDAGCIAMSGSHGGVSSARYALAARPLLSIYNDAGGGKDGAGFAGLAMLQAQGLAGCTVEHTSARIGDAQNTLNDGIINHLNACAAALGIAAGQRCTDAVAAVQNLQEDRK